MRIKGIVNWVVLFGLSVWVVVLSSILPTLKTEQVILQIIDVQVLIRVEVALVLVVSVIETELIEVVLMLDNY